MKLMLRTCLAGIWLLTLPLALAAQGVPGYPDEPGYQRRIAGMVHRWAAAPDIISRGMARATCPDTGQTFLTWALEGETVYSPFTGRAVVQGPTGYFGPKRRDAAGRISHFGGDPLKYALPPATAVLLTQRAGSPTVGEVAAYLSIPGNLRQHYHFAAANWARFLPLAGPRMPAEWHAVFRAAVANYAEDRRPSDGPEREYLPMARTENLVGNPDEFLGGGGTENHKTMWRTSGLLYAQLLPPGSKISGFSQEEAIRLTRGMLEEYIHRTFRLGNGEYNSSTYYPYSFRGFANVHDFSPVERDRAWARAMLDYYVATYGLKVFNGVTTGPQRRGWSGGRELNEWERHLWTWAAGQSGPAGPGSPYTTVPVDESTLLTSLHQATSGYRPNAILTRLLAKDVPLPFRARIAHPDYGMTRPGDHLETLYVSSSFALGSVQLPNINNSGQQTTWQLNVRGPDGSLVLGGGQPRWVHPEGHSPYDQWVQHDGALLLMTAPTEAPAGAPAPTPYVRGGLIGHQGYTRLTALSGELEAARPLPAPDDDDALRAFVSAAPTAAAQWIWIPRARAGLRHHTLADGRRVIETVDTWVVITPLGAAPQWLELPPGVTLPGSHPAKILNDYGVLILPGLPAVAAIEAVERTGSPQMSDLPATPVQLTGRRATYRAVNGSRLELQYEPASLRPQAVIDGQPVDYRDWAGGAVYDSPYLKVKDGVMWVSDGQAAFTLDTTGEVPVWSSADGAPR